MDKLEKQALTEHLTELRTALVRSLIATTIGFVIAYSYCNELGQWLFQPLFEVMPDNASLIFTSYQEGFFFT